MANNKRKRSSGKPTSINAKQFVEKLKMYKSPEELKKYHHDLKSGGNHLGEGSQFMGVPIGQVFALSKGFVEMPPGEIQKLLDSPIHEVRAGGLSIMDKQAALKKTSENRLKELFDLYIRHTNRINDWKLVDVSCRYTVGRYLLDKPRDILYSLARSKNIWERRIAIVSTWYFIRDGEVDDTFKIAEILLKDNQDLIHKATGWMLREAGKRDCQKLLSFLDKHAATMPRVALRYSIEHLSKKQRDHYLSMKKVGE